MNAGNEAQTLEGTVDQTVYHSPDSRWTVIRAQVDGEMYAVTIVGYASSEVESRADFVAMGRWAHDQRYGRQFKFDSIRVAEPSGRPQMIMRLRTYPGVGEAMGTRIVDRFGDETWEIMDTQIDRLLEVSGIGPKALQKIKDHHDLRHGPVAKVEDRLIELGVPPRLGQSIYDRYKDDSIDMIDHHPHRVVRDISGFGWTTAERIAVSARLDMGSGERVDAGVLESLVRAKREGHCAMPVDELDRTSAALLRLSGGVAEDGVKRLVTQGDLRYHDGLLFLDRMDYLERSVSSAVKRLASTMRVAWDVGDIPDHLSDGQRRAVEAIAAGGFVVLTGGPGTGKSTVVANVLDVARRAGESVILCAPTGRAAKRLEETTGHPASTIHRLLGMIPETGDFAHGPSHPLQPALVVIDESSMLDLHLAAAMLSSLTIEHRVLFVGDADQLPSVGPGNVLRDIIRAADESLSSVPVVRLVEIFRRSEGSTITVNAHRILRGESLEPDAPSAGSKGEFFVLSTPTAERAQEKIVEMASRRIPEAYGIDPMTGIQVLCPMHKGSAGTGALNTALQKIYTGDRPSIKTPSNGRVFHLGDRVMQTRNDYDRNVFNGDIGSVIDVTDDAMSVDFSGTLAEFSRKELAPLKLAYAMSIHKSQGGEFPAVLISLLMEHSIMLRRNLLYTAITRAKRLCVLVGHPRAIAVAIANADSERRWTGLSSRLEGGGA